MNVFGNCDFYKAGCGCRGGFCDGEDADQYSFGPDNWAWARVAKRGVYAGHPEIFRLGDCTGPFNWGYGFPIGGVCATDPK